MDTAKKVDKFNFSKMIGFILSIFTVPLYVSGKMVLPILYDNACRNKKFNEFNKIYTIIGYVVFTLGIISNAILYMLSAFYVSAICFIILNILHFVVGLFFLMNFSKESNDLEEDFLADGHLIKQSDDYENLHIISKVFYLIVSVLTAPLFNTGKYIFKGFYDDAKRNEKCKQFIDVYSVVGYVLYGLPLTWMTLTRLISFYVELPTTFLFFGFNIIHFIIGIIVMNVYIGKEKKEDKVEDSKSIAIFFTYMFTILGGVSTIYSVIKMNINLSHLIFSFIGIGLSGIGFLMSKVTKIESKYALLVFILSIGTCVSIFVLLLIVFRLIVVI